MGPELLDGLVQNGVMDGKFVKNFVMDAKVVPNVVMDLSRFKIDGWNSLQPINQNLLERHSVSSDHHMKKLISLREGERTCMQMECSDSFTSDFPCRIVRSMAKTKLAD